MASVRGGSDLLSLVAGSVADTECAAEDGRTADGSQAPSAESPQAAGTADACEALDDMIMAAVIGASPNVHCSQRQGYDL